MGERLLEEVVEKYALAVLDPAEWRSALVATGQALGAVGCALEFADLRTGETALESPIEFDADVMRDYEARVFAINPRVQQASKAMIGVVLDDHELLPHDDAHAPEFLDWLGRTGCRYMQGAKIMAGNGQIGFFGAHYSDRQGPADALATRFQHRLIPHLINFVQAGRALSDKRLRNDVLPQEALDGGKAFALLDRAGGVVECSAGFEAALRNSRVLAVHNGHLASLYPAHRPLMERFLQGAVGRSRMIDAPCPVRLTGPDHPRGTVLRAVPLPARGDVFDVFRPAALVTLVDLDAPFRARGHELMALFSLTPREAEVAALVGEGRMVGAVAAELGITAYTVKHHMKAVFGKMGIERQADLVAILSRLS